MPINGKVICRSSFRLFSFSYTNNSNFSSAKKLSDKSSTFHFANVLPNNAFRINYQTRFLKYLVNKRVNDPRLAYIHVTRHSTSIIIIPRCNIIYSTVRPVQVNYMARVLSNDDELLPRNERRRNLLSCRTANVKQPLVSSRCNLSLSLCNNFPRLLEKGVTSSLPLRRFS